MTEQFPEAGQANMPTSPAQRAYFLEMIDTLLLDPERGVVQMGNGLQAAFIVGVRPQSSTGGRAQVTVADIRGSEQIPRTVLAAVRTRDDSEVTLHSVDAHQVRDEFTGGIASSEAFSRTHDAIARADFTDKAPLGSLLDCIKTGQSQTLHEMVLNLVVEL